MDNSLRLAFGGHPVDSYFVVFEQNITNLSSIR